MGCATAADVRDLDRRAVRRAMTVVGERLVHELRGHACLSLETVPATRKGCAVTRMFAGRVTDLATLEQAVAAHAARLGEKLRREGLGTDNVAVFFHTSGHDATPQRSVSRVAHFPEATSDTLALVAACRCVVRRAWREGAFRYSKAGVVAADLVPLAASQRALPGLGRLDRERSGRLMAAMDAINARHGRGTLVPASAGFAPARRWATKFEMRSPRYTTRLDELPVVLA